MPRALIASLAITALSALSCGVFSMAPRELPHVSAPPPARAAAHQQTPADAEVASIRAFLERWPERTLSMMHTWTRDPNEHVRRLVSEGTRPRLPWAPRLNGFQEDPSPVLALLEELKDDPSEYVRRSVANNLNAIYLLGLSPFGAG